MRVTGVTPHLVDSGGGKNWLFVKVDTDEGLHGWGECYTQTDRDRSIAVMVEELGRYLIGWNPFHIRRFTHIAYCDFASKRGSMDFYCAVSGLEQALWDIVGKALNTPVYNLLGGPVHDRIRVYANGWGGHTYGDTAAQRCADAARQVVERGFTALKFDPFPGPWREYIRRDDEDAAVTCVRAVREAVGDDVDILIEAHRRLAPMHAVRVAEAMAEYRPFWYEEPVSSKNVDALAEVRRRIAIPVVTGEELYTKAEFREVFERQAADILNPDVCNCGGILELKEIAAMAEPYYVAVSPHNYNSTTVGLAATLQASAVMPNFLITEYFVNFEERGIAIAREPLRVEDGYIALPTTPGIGIDLDEEALRRFPYRQRQKRSLT
ncbi:mandelate racemase/muconate lactonizing enzyme family protein [Candidatus Poribacteria bacterium]|nr:mandelate racemase/muconate lactonizing enzyme family protein [Candidatus Poribacteria bacterium]